MSARLAPRGRNALTGLIGGLRDPAVPKRSVLAQLTVTLLPGLAIAALMAFMLHTATAPVVKDDTAGLTEFASSAAEEEASTGLEVAGAEDAAEQESGTLGEPPAEEEEPAEAAQTQEAPGAAAPSVAQETAAPAERLPVPTWLWITLAIAAAAVLLVYWMWTWERLEVFKMLLTSFFPLALLILSVLGSIMFGLATPAEAAAVGAFGGFLLAIAYRYMEHFRTGGRRAGAAVWTTTKDVGVILKESSFLTAKTSAMVCWLFVGSSIFSAAFALLGGQELIERWVLSLGLTPLQFMILAQCIIFILGWPLEWTEIIVIFMPIFIPLLAKFGIDPLFFGLLVALNLQTAFLSPPVAMAAFYLKGVAPPHVTLNQIFGGMLPFMGIQVLAIFLLYMWPQIGLWLPSVLYAR